MFRALTCPSSGGKIVFTQHLVSSLSVNVCTVHWYTVYCADVYTDEEQKLLDLGLQYSMQRSTKSTWTNLVLETERAIRLLCDKLQSALGTIASKKLKQLHNTKHQNNTRKRQLHIPKQINQKITSKNAMITRADKDETTVITHTHDFIHKFDVFSTMHHSIVLFHQPTLMLNFLLLHYYPRHVSSINMPIFRRKNCIHTASGSFALCKRLHSTLVESGLQSQCEYASPACRLNDGHEQCTGNTSREPGTVRGTARRPHFSLAIISVTVQLRI